jgi:uncharacterized membrane protein YadS
VLPIPAIGFGLALLVHGVLVNKVPVSVWVYANQMGHLLMVIALACIGMMSNLALIWKNGKHSLLVGGMAWITLATFCYLMLAIL